MDIAANFAINAASEKEKGIYMWDMPRIATDYLDFSAEVNPNKIAFEDSEREISFKELQIESFCIATELVERKIQNQVIAVYIGRNIKCISALFGINYSGNTYVILDISKFSINRNKKILKKARIKHIIVDRVNEITVRKELLNDNVFIYDEMLPNGCEREKVIAAKNKIISTDPAMIAFTSGSTGYPKGAVISHISIVNFIENISKLYTLNETNILGSHFPFFTISMLFDIYGSVRNMAKNCLFDDKLFSNPSELAQFLCNRRINTLYWSTSAVKLMAYYDFFSVCNLDEIKLVIFGGEVAHAFEINKWIENIPGVTMSNIYGATEITDIVTYKNFTERIEKDDLIPIGKPLENVRIHLMEDGMEADEGELCVEGICLSHGYYNDDIATEKAFTKSEINGVMSRMYHSGDYAKWNGEGELIYLGRKDNMVNRHSQRIELEEIEAVANGLAGVEEVACVYLDEPSKIFLIFTGRAGTVEMEKFLRESLPTNMLPDRIFTIKEMPHTLSTKVDRMKLKEWIVEPGAFPFGLS